jgi:oligopeptide/dipeptide ABC transporter ATP-binding protein
MSKMLLEVDNLSIRFGASVPVDGVSFAVGPGEILGLVGESGSGKSLSLRAILRLLPRHAAMSGRILWRGRDLTALSDAALSSIRGREIGMVFQEPMTALNPVLPIGLQITESLAAHLQMRGRSAQLRAIELLDLVGIPDAKRRLGSYPHEFSGGMRQRAMIAIALAAGPKLLLADEPTTALDVTIQDQILKLLLRLRAELDMAVILVTHDLGVIAETCDRVAVLYAGRIMEAAPAEVIFSASAHPYTRGLIASMPDAGLPRQFLVGIPGSPPDPRDPPPGCRFAPRCRHVASACNDGQPEMIALSAEHRSACLRTHDLRVVRAVPA